jgi:hypothetical protein
LLLFFFAGKSVFRFKHHIYHVFYVLTHCGFLFMQFMAVRGLNFCTAQNSGKPTMPEILFKNSINMPPKHNKYLPRGNKGPKHIARAHVGQGGNRLDFGCMLWGVR